MKRYRLVCPHCDGRQVIYGRDCDTCDARGWVPLGRLLLGGFIGAALMFLAIVGTMTVWP